MFFDKVLVENSELRRAWRAGFGRMEEPEENASLPNICTNLNELIGSEDPNPRYRLSMRTSSVLVEGAARIYRQELKKLLDDFFELDLEMVKRNKRKSADSEEDTPTDSSNSSVPDDTPEHMRRQIPRLSDVSIQRSDNESIALLKAPDMSHSLSSVSNSTNSQQRSQNNVQNGQSAKRRKMTDETNLSSGYPSSSDLLSDRNSEDPISEEDPEADDNQNILQTSEQRTENANAEFLSDDQATREIDDTKKSSQEENSRKYPYIPTFTDKFDFDTALRNELDTEIAKIDEEIANRKSMTHKNSEEIINKAATRNTLDENVTIRKKVKTRADEEHSSAVKRSDDGVVKDSDSGRVNLSPILPSTARKVRNSRRVTKTINRRSKAVVKKDQATQAEDVSFHPNTSENDKSVNENLPFGYLLIHDTYRSRYPSKIVLSSLNRFVRDL